MLITKNVEINLKGRAIKYYEDLGYEIPRYIGIKNKLAVKKDSIIIIKSKDLPPCSEVEIEVQCDYCGKIIKRLWKDYYKRKLKEDSTPNKKDSCYDCRYLKRKESDFLIYGVKHTTNLKSTQDKMKNTCVEKYGCEHPSQNKEIQEKTIKTNLDRYGFKNPSQSLEVREKFKNTMTEKYGFDHPSKVKEICDRMQINRIKTMFKRGNAPKSCQQIYLYQLVGGELNYPVNNMWLDIAFPYENIYIEYDGSGHNLSVLFNNLTQKQFDINELRRYYYLKQNNWNMIKIISLKDKLPNDDKIIEMVEYAKEYINTGHSWIRFDIDNNTIKCSQFEKEYDYGILRKIQKGDLINLEVKNG